MRRFVLLAIVFACLPTWVSAQTQEPSGSNVQHVICDSGCGSAAATPDGTTFTAGVTSASLIAGAFNDALADLTSGKYAAPRLTKQRAFHINLRDASGNELGLAAIPLFVQFGSAQTVTANAGTNLNTSLLALEAGGNLASIKTDVDKIPSQGQAAMSGSTPVVLASDQTAVSVSPSAVAPRSSGLTALNGLNVFTATLDTAGYASAGFEIQAGTLAGTVGFYKSTDGVTWTGASVVRHDNLALVQNIVFTNPNVSRRFDFVLSGPERYIRANVDAYTSGTALGQAQASMMMSGFAQLGLNLGAEGGAASPYRALTAGVDGGNLTRTLILTNAAPTGTEYGAIVRDPNLAKPSSCGITPYDSGSLDVPSFYPTVVVASTTCVQSITVVNQTRTAIKFSLGDGATPTRAYFNDWIAPGEARTVALGSVQLASGIKWNASGAGLSGQVRGYQ